MEKYDILDNEILINQLFINDNEFNRYYHHNNIPTRYFVSHTGMVYTEISDKIMKPGTNKSGYLVLGIHIKKKSKKKYIQVHKMVATIYCGGYHKHLVVDHIDGNKKNNNSNNLEWVSYSTNSKRAYDKGFHKKMFGDDNKNSKYNNSTIHSICKMLESGKSIQEVSEITKVPKSFIYKLTSMKARRDITSIYKFPNSLFKGPNEPLSVKTKEKIIKMYNSGIPLKTIQVEFDNVSYAKIVHAIYDK